MKNPVPRDWPAVIDATAGNMRLTISSSESGGAGGTTVGAGGGSMGAGSSTAIGSEADVAATGVVTAAGDASFGGAGAAPRKRNMARIAAAMRARMPKNSSGRALDCCGAGAATGSSIASSDPDVSAYSTPHLHLPTRLGTRRPHDGQPHERFAETGCSMNHRGDRAAKTRLRLRVIG